MPAIVLTQLEVRRLLPMRKCVELMSEALTTLARGDAENPLRSAFEIPEEIGLLGLMPGYIKTPQALGLKVVAVIPANHGTEYDSHQGVVMLFEAQTGEPLAIMNASEITAIRTAAVSGLATRLLAREKATVLALLGSGVQARTHLEAMLAVRDIGCCRVYSPTARNREKFAQQESRRHQITVEAVDSAQQAVEGADIVCTTTSSSEPVLKGEWLAQGAHINAVGSSVHWARELDTSAVVRSRMFVDRRESTTNEAGDYLTPLKEGAITDAHLLGELGEILLGRIAGRETPHEITLFKSLGLAVEDLAAAHYVYHRARAGGIGVTVELGGVRDAPP